MKTPAPFSLLQPFSDRLRVGLFGKTADVSSDEECAALLGFDSTAKLNQVHGTAVFVADTLEGIPDGDGLIVTKPGLALSIRFADCQAFVIYAPEKKVLGVLHAGWRGMAAEAITALYAKLRETYGVLPQETYVGAVPSLCRECADFSDPLRELPEHLHPFVDVKRRKADLQAAADTELLMLGVPADHIERIPVCTKCGEGYWSWRRDRSEDARNYLVAGLLE